MEVQISGLRKIDSRMRGSDKAKAETGEAYSLRQVDRQNGCQGMVPDEKEEPDPKVSSRNHRSHDC